MKNIVLFCSAAGMMVLAGCQPRLAQVEYSSEEASWQQMIRRNYPGYKAPQTLPPAVSGHTSDKLATVPVKGQGNPVAAPVPAAEPADVNCEEVDPADVVDKSAEKTLPQAAAPDPAVKQEPAEKNDKAPAVVKPAPAAVKPAAVIEPPDPTGSIVHVVRAGDTLAALSKRYYGSSSHQDVIVRANADLVRNPNKLYPGMKLIIPKF